MYLFIGSWPDSNNKLTSLALASMRPAARVVVINETGQTALLQMSQFNIDNLLSVYVLPNPRLEPYYSYYYY